MTPTTTRTLALAALLLGPARLAGQAGNLNFTTGLRFDGGGRHPAVGAELQLGPRPWWIKGTVQVLGGFSAGDRPDLEGAMGATWIWERTDAPWYPFLGVGGAVIQRHYSWASRVNAAVVVHGGALIRRGTNGNFGIDIRFLNGSTRDLLAGQVEKVRYLQIAALLGWGW